jgi:hypothetical protein
MVNPAIGNPMQANAMERQGSAINMNDARNSGSPNNGDNAPSPKRLRTEGSMSQLNQARPGQQPNNQVGTHLLQSFPLSPLLIALELALPSIESHLAQSPSSAGFKLVRRRLLSHCNSPLKPIPKPSDKKCRVH